MTEEISGLIERVTFHNDEGGFCVLRVRVRGHRDETTVIGSLPSVTAGAWLVAEGWWVRDKEHGLQFKATNLKTVPPTTVEGIERYLGGSVKGIGPILAKKLVKRFGAGVLGVIKNRAADLESVDGIGPKRRERIEAAWRSLRRVTYPRYRCRGRFFGRRVSCESLAPPMLKFAALFVPGFELRGLWPAFAGGLILSVLNMILRHILRQARNCGLKNRPAGVLARLW